MTSDRLELDGAWCPMAHSNGFDDSFHDLPPLRKVRSTQNIPRPALTFISLGACTGERFAVGIFHGPHAPSLAAFDYQNGSILWTSPFEDFPPADFSRETCGILMAKLWLGNSPPVRRIFGANWAEFNAYDDAGRRVWKRSTAELVPASGGQIGIPRSLSPTIDNALIVATDRGWVIKLSPRDGKLIDALHMRTQITIGGQLVAGHFYSTLSSISIANCLYLVAAFRRDDAGHAQQGESPVYMVRLDIAGRSGEAAFRMRELAHPGEPGEASPDRVELSGAGTPRYYGSPVGMIMSNGNPLIIGCTSCVINGETFPEVVAVEDQAGVLVVKWRARLGSRPGEIVAAAPGFYAPAGICIIPTQAGVHIIDGVEQLSGDVRPTRFTPALDLLTNTIRVGVADLKLTSPVSVTVDHERQELVAYVNTNLRRRTDNAVYGFMTAFTVPLDVTKAARPLWTEALLLHENGAPAPHPGTCGQPALFQYFDGRATATGMIVTTWGNGTVILR